MSSQVSRTGRGRRQDPLKPVHDCIVARSEPVPRRELELARVRHAGRLHERRRRAADRRVRTCCSRGDVERVEQVEHVHAQLDAGAVRRTRTFSRAPCRPSSTTRMRKLLRASAPGRSVVEPVAVEIGARQRVHRQPGLQRPRCPRARSSRGGCRCRWRRRCAGCRWTRARGGSRTDRCPAPPIRNRPARSRHATACTTTGRNARCENRLVRFSFRP